MSGLRKPVQTLLLFSTFRNKDQKAKNTSGEAVKMKRFIEQETDWRLSLEVLRVVRAL